MTRDSDSYFSDDTDDINCNNNSSYNNKKKRKINQVGVDASSVDNNNDLSRNEYNCKKKKYKCKKKGKWSVNFCRFLGVALRLRGEAKSKDVLACFFTVRPGCSFRVLLSD